jgi:hypothetical protein
LPSRQLFLPGSPAVAAQAEKLVFPGVSGAHAGHSFEEIQPLRVWMFF